jgi:ABC-2 type transport system permease protein
MSLSQIRKKLLPVLVFAKIDIKRLFRDKVAIFFTFVFPLLFLFVFGGIFGRNSGSISFNVAVLNGSSSQFATDFIAQGKKDKVLKVDDKVTTLDTAKEKMSRGELDAAIILPKAFGEVGEKGYPTGQVEVVYNKSSEQAGTTLAAILGSVFDGMNAKFVPTDKPFSR